MKRVLLILVLVFCSYQSNLNAAQASQANAKTGNEVCLSFDSYDNVKYFLKRISKKQNFIEFKNRVYEVQENGEPRFYAFFKVSNSKDIEKIIEQLDIPLAFQPIDFGTSG